VRGSAGAAESATFTTPVGAAGRLRIEGMGEEFTSPEAAEPAGRKRHPARWIILSLVSILVVLSAGAVGYLGYLNHTLTTNVRHAALLPTPTPGEKVPGTVPVARGAQNILLIGSDSRGSVANGRSDVIVLVHVSTDHQKVFLIHFPRDLYVDIPGHGKDKINAAFAYGGSPLLVRTMQALVDVRIDHVAIIGFDGFKAMTDAVGGVDVYAEEASNEPGTGTVHVGVNHLDGEAALGFVRERHQLSLGDISRGRRQLAFLKALMFQSLSRQTLLNPVRFAELVDASTRHLTVDNAFSFADLRSEAFSMSGLRRNDTMLITAPFSGFGTTPQGASIDVVDEARMAQLSTALRNDDMGKVALGKQIP
jgi:polyisoprenyl-teichoic acid--peptidoglycan teichoic acid transferase